MLPATRSLRARAQDQLAVERCDQREIDPLRVVAFGTRIDRDEIDARHSTEHVTCGPDSSPSDPTAGSELLSTLGNERGEDVENALRFLEPSDKRGSLGRLTSRR